VGAALPPDGDLPCFGEILPSGLTDPPRLLPLFFLAGT
jgi:hypothetical protein